MPNLQGDAGPFRMRHEVRSRLTVGGKRLLDQHVNPGIDQIARNFMVKRRRHRHRDGIDFADQPAVIAIGYRAILLRRRTSPREIGIGDGHQPRPSLRRIVARVVGAERPHPDHADSN